MEKSWPTLEHDMNRYLCTLDISGTAVCENLSSQECSISTPQNAHWDYGAPNYVTVYQGWNRMGCRLPKGSPLRLRY
jgi:hypothetical protein